MWFKVDDLFHAHRKARRVRRSHGVKRRDAAPFGLWVLAGSWCGLSGTDGFIPLEVLEEWDDDAKALAERLVDGDLWTSSVQGGEEGYLFHDWEDFRPGVPGIEDAAEAGALGNHLRWHVARGVMKDGCVLCQENVQVDRGESPPTGGDDRGDDGGESGPRSQTRPDPTRPDPTNPSPEAAPSEAVTRICNHLADRIEHNGVKRPTVGKRWHDAGRLLMDADGFTEAQVHWLIDKAADDDFWRANILSMSKLREKAPQLKLKFAPPATNGHATLPHVSQLEAPPPGLTDQESYDWQVEQRRKLREGAQ